MSRLLRKDAVLDARSLWLKFDPMGEIDSVMDEAQPGHSQWIEAKAVQALPDALPSDDDLAGAVRRLQIAVDLLADPSEIALVRREDLIAVIAAATSRPPEQQG